MDWNTVVSIFTILAFYLAWTAFVFDRKEKRNARKSEKKDILVSIQEELGLMSHWLGTSYSDQSINNGMKTWHPFDMVYRLGWNQATRNAISLRSVTLLSEELTKLLVLFNQLLSNFEQQAERIVNFNVSNSVVATAAFYIHDRILKKGRVRLWAYINSLYEKLNKGTNLKPAEVQLVGTNRMFRDLHVIGIGNENQVNPISLRRAYILLSQLVNGELINLNKEKQFIEPVWIRIFNIIIYLILPVTIGLFFLFSNGWKGGEIMLRTNDIIVLSTLLIILIDSVFLLYYLNKQNAPVRTTVVQFLGVILFIPLVFLLSYTGKIDDRTVSTLLGALVGYVFGKTSLKEEWGGRS